MTTGRRYLVPFAWWFCYHVQRILGWLIYDAQLSIVDFTDFDHGQPFDVGLRGERFYLDRSGDTPRLVRWDAWEG